MTGQGTIVATGSIGYPPGLGSIGQMIGAEKVMTMTSTYDHRVIQGAESGQFLQVVEAYLQGEHGFYEAVFQDLAAELGDAPQPPAPAATAAVAARPGDGAPAPAGPPDEALLQAVQAAVSLIKAHRMHGHLAAKLDPLQSEPEGDPALDPGAARPHPRGDGADPGADPARRRPRRHAGRRPPAPARDLLRHDRLRDRAHLLAPPAHLAAREDRDRAPSASRSPTTRRPRCCAA
jgi:hypothetical protein